jgi:glycogen debranching enzyme
VSATLALRGRSATVRGEAGQLLKGCLDHLNGAGLGQICELFDGDAPHRPGGLPACARAAGELLRCYVEDVLDLAPVPEGDAKVSTPAGRSAARPI